MPKKVKFGLQRKAVAHMTTESWQRIPHVSYLYEPDVTELYDAYQRLNRAKKEKISLNTLILKAISEALKKAPQLNAALTYNHKTAQGQLKIHDEINIAIPWLLDDGRMITPILAGAEKLSLAEMATEIEGISRKIENTDIDELLFSAALSKTAADVRSFKPSSLLRILFSLKDGNVLAERHPAKKKGAETLTKKDLLTATITVTNIGSLHKEQRGFLALFQIMPPQVCAIGAGALAERPGIYESKTGKKEIGIRKVLPLCIAFDHRALDFSDVLPFVKALDEIFSDPKILGKW